MTALATRENGNGSRAIAPSQSTGVVGARFSVPDMWMMAEQLALSGFFKDVTTPEKAFTLMLLCDADGLHPMDAIRRYDIIEGRPAMKAAAIQAEFIRRGGKIEIVELSGTKCTAIFSHPTLQPRPLEQTVTFEQFSKSYAVGRDGIKKNWKDSPSDMLWARLVSKTCTKIDAGIKTGIPSVEEAHDIADAENALPVPASVASILNAPSTAQQPTGRDVKVPGQPDGDFDARPYVDVVTASADVLGAAAPQLHRDLMNRATQAGHYTGERPAKVGEAVKAMAKIYGATGALRDWVRGQLAEIEATKARAEEAAMAEEVQPSSASTKAEVNSLFPVSPVPSDEWQEGRE